MRIVIALGGNSMVAADGGARPEHQRAAIESAAGPIADLVAKGHQVLLTHGNGPQVGNLLVKNEIAAAHVPPVSLDWCGAQTQATIGLLMMNALVPALRARGIDREVATLVSRTRVDGADPGFDRPTKPIGRYLTAAEASELIASGDPCVEVSGRGWRRVVASPEPLECLDAPAANVLMAAGYIVVCSGGGGIPVVRNSDGSFQGVDAVIDKDLTAALVARGVGADLLVIATDVDAVQTGWGTAEVAEIGRVTTSQMRIIAEAEGFAAGSMGPKVEAVMRFTASGGRAGIITSLARIADAVDGGVGTQVVPDQLVATPRRDARSATSN